MYFKKVTSGLLAAALVATSVQLPAATEVSAKEIPTDGLVASFTFDDNTLNNAVSGGAAASAVVTGITAYDGNVQYVAGKSGKAVKLGEYGLEVNQKQLGDNYTVSVWMKPDGKLASNQAVLFLGDDTRAGTEKWYGLAGKNGSNTVKWWKSGTTPSGSAQWVTTASPVIGSDDWHHVVMTGSKDTATLYVDGQLVTADSGQSNPDKDSTNPLDTSTSDIYLGVNYWDGEFTGEVDEVNVYNRTLSADEVTALYDAVKDDQNSKEDLFNWGEVDASIAGAVNKGETKQISVTLPDGITEDDVTITYESDTPDVASVDKTTGVVTGNKAGTATVTATVALNGDSVYNPEDGSYAPTVAATKTATVKVSVLDPDAANYPSDLVAYYNFDDGTVTNQIAKGSQGTLASAGDAAYSGKAAFDDSINESKGSALKLGSYGLDLNQVQLGKEFTVSLWAKANGKIPENSTLLFMGYNDPAENWVGMAGKSGNSDTSNVMKIWANDKVNSSYSWTTLGEQTIDKDWHHITFVGTEDKITYYVDGVKQFDADSVNPLDGENSDIFVGLTYWSADTCFNGLVDDVRVYNTAKTEDEVTELDADLFNELLQAKADAAFTDETLLGKNTDKADVKYNLNLPEELDGATVTWTSSNEDVIKADGTVLNQTEATDVTVTATIKAGKLTATKNLTVTVAALDRSVLTALVAQAKTLDITYATEASAKRLTDAIAAGEAAASYEEVEAATTELNKAITGLTLTEAYENPFGLIAEPTAKQTMKVGESRQILYVPDEVKATTEITYLSSNDAVVTYADGKATAKAEGKATVTAIVTSKYNNYVVEYSVALDITKADDPTPNPDPTPTPNPTPNPGNNGGNTTPDNGTNNDSNATTTKASLNVSSVKLGAGEKFSLKAENATGKVAYSTSNKKVATVTSAGKITAKKKGKATITATLADGTKLTCKVTVKNAPKKISLNKKKVSLKKGKTFTVKAKLPSNTASYKLNYKSSNKKVATVDTNGKITAKKKGKATITVTTFNKKKATIKVTVK